MVADPHVRPEAALLTIATMNDQPNSTRKDLLREAFVAVADLQAQLEALRRARHEPIAIIGLACRFPMAEDTGAFWRLLCEGGDATAEVPPERWDVDQYYDPDVQTPGRMYTRRGAFLRAANEFDPAFFSIAPREALMMDPQQRLLLEVSWEALESAGVAPTELSGTQTGVFAGICNNDYAQILTRLDATLIDAY